MDQWDKDKYLELSKVILLSLLSSFTDSGNTGKFLLNNYKQAIEIISDYTPDINALKAVIPGLADEVERRRVKIPAEFEAGARV